MEKWEIAKDAFNELLKKNYKEVSLIMARKFHWDNFGMGEMNMDIVESRGNWYSIDTDAMTIQSVEAFVDDLFECCDCPDIQGWLVEIYESTEFKLLKDGMFIECDLSLAQVIESCLDQDSKGLYTIIYQAKDDPRYSYELYRKEVK